MLLEALIYRLPWWAWGIGLVVIWALLSYVVGVVFGWKYARAMMWPAVAIVGAAAFYLRARQAGYADRKAEELGAADKAVNDFKDHRHEVDRKPIDQIDRENQPWLKP